MNRVTLDYVKTKAEDAGFSLADNHGSSIQYIDGTPEDDLDLLRFVVKNGDDIAQDLLQFLRENEKGIEINDTFYSYEKIKDILNP